MNTENKEFRLEMEPRKCAAPCPLTNTALLEQLVKALTPKPFRKRHPILFWGFCLLLLAGVIGGIASSFAGSGVAATDSYAVVRVEGPILNTRPLLRWVEKVGKDPAVKGVLLRIDSPGGGAAASQELYEALRSLNAKKPVVASMGSVAASGGLMVAMGARHVVANPSTVTGSIGVRMDVPQLQGLMGKLGLGQETLTTGRYKDAGSPTRPMTQDEKLYLGRILQDMHDQFVQLVAEGRKMPVDKVRAVADGRIFTGREARELGIVDELGGQNEAVAALHKAVGTQEALKRLEQPKENKLWKELMESLLGLNVSALGVDVSALGGVASTPVPSFLFSF